MSKFWYLKNHKAGITPALNQNIATIHNNTIMAQSYSNVEFTHKEKNETRHYTFTPSEERDFTMYVTLHRLAYLLPELEEEENGVLVAENGRARLTIKQFII